ncbi:hypothetical protein ANMWB30_37790 [Arthrobacter sp. MWB30]|nr:hypothetical protein ANMWB30_37790 [Arthrobacter sp. MWB30]
MSPKVPVWRMQWKNFRGYERGPIIEFPALTLLIGRNNVGKTSVYSPLLLLGQTLEATKSETALLFRGSAVDFGSYKDVVTDHEVNRDISFRLDFGVRGRGESRTKDRTAAGIDLTFGHSDEYPALIRKSVVLDEDGKPLITRTRTKDGRFRVTSSLLPRVTEVGRPLSEVTELRKMITEESPEGFLFWGRRALGLPRRWRQDPDRWAKVQTWYSAAMDMFERYAEINYRIQRNLHEISYIGPLRSSPQRSYRLSPESPTSVGRDGDWAAEVLLQSSQQTNSDTLKRTNSWLEKMGYGRLSFEKHGDYFQVFITKSDSHVSVNIADCGMGLSQILPILVQGCVMRAGETLIAQQPEIHLNPAQQDVITDFLVELSEAGRRVIVETHSEHVLTRLRRRIAEGHLSSDDDVALYFCDSQRDRSTVTRIPMGDLAEIQQSDWPAGFFGESLENAMKLALAQSRRRAEVYG